MASGRTKLISRQRGARDAKIILVATEGAKTEPLYFEVLRENRIIDRFRVVVEVVGTSPETNDSAPEYVLQRLKDARSKHGLTAIDECWLVLDVDKWGDKKLSKVTAEAQQALHGLAISNPCFEVWLLLHFDENAPDKKEQIITALRAALPGFSKNDIPPEPFTSEAVEAAIVRGKKGDSSHDRWPQKPGTTHVHRLLESILKKSRPTTLAAEG